ncbi:hypothetical protein PAPYR_12969 [Paratrimastix pyriformis]|uniref:Uncharacterized protein n=1 Tax=Paratrimastix pyriformis TaxID=342808 RepID=A0ABQ8U108_9EUKA|nr:hypothetical protein PAPYR_12969 [Paratrimastix pyriformis]
MAFFSLGWPQLSKLPIDEEILSFCVDSKNRILAAVTRSTISLWTAGEYRTLVASSVRTQDDLNDFGANRVVVWDYEGSQVIVLTDKEFLSGFLPKLPWGGTPAPEAAGPPVIGERRLAPIGRIYVPGAHCLAAARQGVIVGCCPAQPGTPLALVFAWDPTHLAPLSLDLAEMVSRSRPTLLESPRPGSKPADPDTSPLPTGILSCATNGILNTLGFITNDGSAFIVPLAEALDSALPLATTEPSPRPPIPRVIQLLIPPKEPVASPPHSTPASHQQVPVGQAVSLAFSAPLCRAAVGCRSGAVHIFALPACLRSAPLPFPVVSGEPAAVSSPPEYPAPIPSSPPPSTCPALARPGRDLPRLLDVRWPRAERSCIDCLGARR